MGRDDRVQAIVFASPDPDPDRGGRTARALHLAGARPRDLSHLSWFDAVAQVRSQTTATWLVRAGAWPMGPVDEPRPPESGRSLIALGAEFDETGDVMSAAWSETMRSTGGVFDGVSFPHLVSAHVSHEAVEALSDAGAIEGSLRVAARTTGARVVHHAGLDVRNHALLRIAELVTSVQRGGAERIAIDLARGLRRHRFDARLVTLGRPTRDAFPDAPDDLLDLSSIGGADADHRARTVARRLVDEGFDLVHGHLLDRGTVRALASRGLPVALTLHNTREAWPQGSAALTAREVQLMIACSQRVEREAGDTHAAIPLRTIWNGIDFAAFATDPVRDAAALRLRKELGFDESDFVLAAVANPRPQKRLHLLPAILAATIECLRETDRGRRVRLVIAGEASHAPAARSALRRLERAIDEAGVRDDMRLVGAARDVPTLLRAADVLVSASAHEGLSLAQIEALASGRTVVTTDVGGASELAYGNEAVRVLPRDAPPEAFAAVLAPLAPGPRRDGRGIARRDFDLGRMVSGYARLLPRVLRGATTFAARSASGLWLITNNFSTGGAQTSARRLLEAMRLRGHRVRAATIEEQPEFPTAGRKALIESGIPVTAVPEPRVLDPEHAVRRLLDAIDADPAEAVLLWNVIPEHKVLFVDALLGTPVFDVSPGEMYFASLERYFENPRPGVPYRTAAEYARRLAGVVVKYDGERERAETMLGRAVHVIPNGVPQSPSRAVGARERLIMGTSARLEPKKHVDRLIRALRLAHPRLPPYELRVQGGVERGDENYLDTLTSLASGVNVVFCGDADGSAAFLEDVDVFALVAEPAGCPNASLEAMARGIPVVATEVGGMREQIPDESKGRLVGRSDEAALAEALIELASDSSLRLRVGNAGQEHVRARFSMDGMVDAYLGVLGLGLLGAADR